MTDRDEHYVNLWNRLVNDRNISYLPFYEQMDYMRQALKAGEVTPDERSAMVHMAVKSSVECKLTIASLNPQ